MIEHMEQGKFEVNVIYVRNLLSTVGKINGRNSLTEKPNTDKSIIKILE